MIALIAFLGLTLLAAGLFLATIVHVMILWIAKQRKKPTTKQVKRLKRVAMCFAIALIFNIGLVTVSQRTASTPPILDANGSVRENSVAELIPLDLNGRREWVSIRGWNKQNPVLLFLAGGPGGTQMAAVRYELAALEEHFVVVNWDQPGSGKSFYAEKTKDITVETYVQDGLALTEYLKGRFGQEKIYLVGESWGSALGIFLADRDPLSYHALIGAAQMVDFAETERIDYALALRLAKSNGEKQVLRRLTQNGPPLYHGKDVTWKSAVYLNYLGACMARNPEIKNPGYNTARDILSPEYGLLDQINYIRGVIRTFNHVYPQLYGVDLRIDYKKIDVPVYFYLGRHDINAPLSLSQAYYEALDAPRKELVWFEHSGHSPWINERELFCQRVLDCFSGTEGE